MCDLLGRKIVLREHQTKNSEERILPLTDELITMLALPQHLPKCTWLSAFDKTGLSFPGLREAGVRHILNTRQVVMKLYSK